LDARNIDAIAAAQAARNPNNAATAVPQPGTALNFQQQEVRPGRVASNLEAGTFGQLVTQLGVDPLVLINFLSDNLVTLDGAVRGPGSYLVGPSALLQDVVMAAGGTLNWADESGVELITTTVDVAGGSSHTERLNLPLRQGSLASYVVRPHDELRFKKIYSSVDAGEVTVQGEMRFVGTYKLTRGERLSDLLARAGGLTNSAYPYGTVFLRKSAAALERDGYLRTAREIQDQLIVAMTRVGNDKIDPATFASMQTFVNEIRNQTALGRISVVADPSVLAARPELDVLLEAGDVIYVPPRPSTISVLGQVRQAGNYAYQSGRTVADYISQAGGYSRFAEENETFVVLPDGSARRIEKSWFRLDPTVLPPGSAIVVPRDITPLDMRQTIIDVSQVFSQFIVSLASIAVLSKQ